MGAATQGIVTSAGASPISLDEYLRTSYRPDCDFVEGALEERHVGKKKHSYTQARIAAWFIRLDARWLEALTELRMSVAPNKVRIPDVVVSKVPLPDEEVFTSPPWLCIEIMSPDDTMSGLQDRLDDYLSFGVPNIWVVDPYGNRGWVVTAAGWATALDGVMRTGDGLIEMPLADVLLP